MASLGIIQKSITGSNHRLNSINSLFFIGGWACGAHLRRGSGFYSGLVRPFAFFRGLGIGRITLGWLVQYIFISIVIDYLVYPRFTYSYFFPLPTLKCGITLPIPLPRFFGSLPRLFLHKLSLCSPFLSQIFYLLFNHFEVLRFITWDSLHKMLRDG